ncbi:hypothetical protein Slala03_30320 [Streptomyces lavendulae subsp. lavendulae]|uniref:hypothetical protein n=1 Tax=Streptomyces lavendulae TaxID=1914 RepID=UPI0024A130E9|nr:hypothetical protein [Streptomyces lavendulae]GLV83343.1 hypothetical protein Slala03_30320 [Streptomyces lavendulae subsp. lavendulae]
MRARHVAGAVAVAAVAVLGAAACSAGRQAGPQADPPSSAPPSAGQPASASARDRLRGGLLTQAQLPRGFHLLTAEINSTTTAAPHGPASTVAIASMPCSELGVESFMTHHAPPLEDVAVGMEQVPEQTSEQAADDGWFGQEALDRYAPGRAAEVMDAIRAAAQRCPSYANALDSSTTTQETVSVTAADVPADDSLVLRIASALPDDPEPYVSEQAFVREGDVILMVQKLVAKKPRAGVEAVLPAAVAAYRAATAH